MCSAGLEPAIPASKLPPTYTFDCAAAGMAIIKSLSTTYFELLAATHE